MLYFSFPKLRPRLFLFYFCRPPTTWKFSIPSKGFSFQQVFALSADTIKQCAAAGKKCALKFWNSNISKFWSWFLIPDSVEWWGIYSKFEIWCPIGTTSLIIEWGADEWGELKVNDHVVDTTHGFSTTVTVKTANVYPGLFIDWSTFDFCVYLL